MQNRQDNIITEQTYRLSLIPIIIIITITPLILFRTEVGYNILQQILMGTDDSSYYDIFTNAKAIFLIIITVIGILFFVLDKLINKQKVKKLKYYYYCIGIYGFFIIISTITAKYISYFKEEYQLNDVYIDNQIALFGSWERFEGMFVLLAYLIILFLSINVVNKEKDTVLLVNSLLISSFIIGIIGVFQLFGLNFFEFSFLQKILVPNDFEMKFNLGKNVLFSTLYNPNYVGSYMVMILPIAVSLFLYSKKGIMNIIYWFISALIFANLIGCRSTGGFIAAVIAGVVFLMFFKSKLLKEKRKIIILFISFLGIFVLLDLKFNGDIIGDIIRNITKTKVAEEEKNEVLIEDIELKNDELIISEKDKALKIKITDDIRIYDEEDNQLDVSVDNNYILIDDEENNYYKIMIADESSGIIFIENKKVYFSFLKNGKMLLHGSKYMIYDQLKDVETFGFKGMEGFATKRGYIWSRTFPLLKDYLLIGSGPDTYVFVFPQYDLLGKLNAYNSFGTIIDKPHNLYLQIAINTGLISLLAFLGIVIVYFVSCIKLFWKKNLTKVEEYIGMSIFISVLAYCIAGLGNDSVVSVAPIFWILLGVGISINYRLNKHNEIV